ncbi:MAG TPA: GpE family phage tail protein [Pedomonas sp.]
MGAVFHWPPSELDAMSLAELMRWRELAIERLKLIKE